MLHRTVWNPADEGVVGRWGAASASIDWCEANYQISFYVAEWCNTLTNVAFVALALFGLQKSVQNRLGGRFMLAYAGLALIGVGSALFHTTLSYKWQLCDELPMIYVSTLVTWIVFDLSPVNSTPNYSIPFGLLAYDVLFTYLYLRWPNPVFHQVSYGCLVAATTFRAVWLLFNKLQDTPLNKARNSETRRLQIWGSFYFMLAFFIWNLDNLLCVQSTRLKRSLGLPLAWGLEGHGWWHLFTGLGVYMIICAMCYFTLSVRDSPEHYELHYAFGFLPWVCRTPKGFYAVEVDTSTSATESTRLIN